MCAGSETAEVLPAATTRPNLLETATLVAEIYMCLRATDPCMMYMHAAASDDAIGLHSLGTDARKYANTCLCDCTLMGHGIKTALLTSAAGV